MEKLQKILFLKNNFCAYNSQATERRTLKFIHKTERDKSIFMETLSLYNTALNKSRLILRLFVKDRKISFFGKLQPITRSIALQFLFDLKLP